MKPLTVIGWLVLLGGAWISPSTAFPWLSAAALPLIGAGFLWSPRAAFLIAGMSSVAGAVLAVRGTPPGSLVGYWVLMGLLPLILWDEDQRRIRRDASLKSKEVDLQKQFSVLEADTNRMRVSIREQEQAIQRIIELYGLSKKFLATLDDEQALQIVSEALEEWLGHVSPQDRQGYVQSLRTLLDRGEATMNDLVALAPPAAGAGLHSHWGIVIGQLALGLQRVLLYRQVQESAIHDSLTGLLVRRYLRERLMEEVSRAVRRGTGLAFLMVDIDHFKNVNDKFGHLVGDVVLREVARLIQRSVREIDLVGRYGGEEFAIVLPEADLELGTQIAERIRQTVEQTAIQAYDERVQITVSVGVNFLSAGAPTAEQLIDRADQVLYRAKRTGRNKVIAVEPENGRG